MTLMREFEERVHSLAVKGATIGPLHLYVGQEAVAVGVCAALETTDWIASTHRGHGHCIAKSVDVRRMMAELFGKVSGTNRGKGGSMHITEGGEFLAVNIGSDEWNYQVKDLAEAVAKIIPDVDVSINENAQPDKRSYRVSFDLFKKLAPNHQPEVDLISSIKGLKDGLVAMNFKNSDFRNSKFMRLRVLTDLQDKGLLTDKLEWASNHNLG